MNPKIVVITTTRCNLRCAHCLRGYYTDHSDVSLDLLARVLPEAKELGFHHAGLTGGEPFMHPQFDEMVALIHRLGFTWSFVTNGLVYRQYENALKEYGSTCTYAAVSLDGLQENHDAIRAPGSFKKALEAIDYFKDLGIYTKIGFTLNTRNYAELPDILELAIERCVDAVMFASVIPNAFNQDLVLSWEHKKTAHALIAEAKAALPICIDYVTSLYTLEDADRFCGNLNDPEPAINPFGEYILCCDTDGKGAVIGDLNNQPFTELFIQHIKQMVKLKALRRQLVAEDKTFEHFNSCHFCNKILLNESL